MLSFFFFNDTATTEIYTLSLHDALPIYHHDAEKHHRRNRANPIPVRGKNAVLIGGTRPAQQLERDRKSTRLNSSHGYISYAVFCLKKKNSLSCSSSVSYCSDCLSSSS